MSLATKEQSRNENGGKKMEVAQTEGGRERWRKMERGSESQRSEALLAAALARQKKGFSQIKEARRAS